MNILCKIEDFCSTHLLVCTPYTACTQDQISDWEAGESRSEFCHNLSGERLQRYRTAN